MWCHMLRKHAYKSRAVAMMVHSRQMWVGVFACVLVSMAVAGTSSSFLQVAITLNKPSATAPPLVTSSPSPEVCVSEALSAQTNAQVRVVCTTGRVVTIAAIPGRLFLGTHGGAFRYVFVQSNPRTISSADKRDAKADESTPSVFFRTDGETNDSAEPPEMLVIF